MAGPCWASRAANIARRPLGPTGAKWRAVVRNPERLRARAAALNRPARAVCSPLPP
jgi:hypothetical protein